MACDICNATGRRSIELLSAYKTDDIKSVCPDCETVLNAKVWKLRAVTDGILQAWMKRFISQRRDKLLSEPQRYNEAEIGAACNAVGIAPAMYQRVVAALRTTLPRQVAHPPARVPVSTNKPGETHHAS